MHHDPDSSWITDPDPHHPKGTQPKFDNFIFANIAQMFGGNQFNHFNLCNDPGYFYVDALQMLFSQLSQIKARI